MDDLKMLTTKDLAELLGVDRHIITWLRAYKLLPYRKIGKHKLTSQDEFRQFVRETEGLSLSNEAEIRSAALKKGHQRLGERTDTRNDGLVKPSSV